MIQFSPLHQQQAAAFFKHYEEDVFATCPDEALTDLLPDYQRTCRFCKKRFPQVKFRSAAHIFPEFLGNKYLVSDFECDSCNKKFGRYESHLDNYIGMARTLYRTEGKNGIPTIFSNDEKIKAGREKVFGHNMIMVGSTGNDASRIAYDPEKKRYSILYKKKPYVPFQVYQSLLKIALTLLRREDVATYEIAFRLLHTKAPIGIQNKGIYVVATHRLPGAYENPFACLFKAKASNDTTAPPPHTLVLFYKCFMFQIFLPFCMDYLQKMKGLSFNAPIFPPCLDGSGTNTFGEVLIRVDDFSSTIAVAEDEEINFQFCDDEERQFVAVNRFTAKRSPDSFDPKKTVGLLLSLPDAIINLPEQ